MVTVRNKCETPVKIPVPGIDGTFRPGEVKEIPDEWAKKLNSKHFEVIGLKKKKGGD